MSTVPPPISVYRCSTAVVLGVHVSSPMYFKLMYAVNFKLRMAYFKIDVCTESILIQMLAHTNIPRFVFGER